MNHSSTSPSGWLARLRSWWSGPIVAPTHETPPAEADPPLRIEPKSSLVNLGCGSVYHPAWCNLDLTPAGPEVIACDLSRGIPLDDGVADAVYSSHVLEHLPPATGRQFVAEMARVLKPGGIVRIVVPDLEQIARLYLESLEACRRDERDAPARHDWMLIELIDQMSREQSGGQMMRYWQHLTPETEHLVRSRLGREVDRFLAMWKGLTDDERTTLCERTDTSLATPPADPDLLAFLHTGERHRWMYDSENLKRLLASEGYVSITRQRGDTSAIDAFSSYQLDTDETGQTRKPDSLFMEAMRPA